MARVYSVAVPGTEDPEKGWGPIHRCTDGQEPTLGIYDEVTHEMVTTAYENFQASRHRHSNRPFLGYRPIAKDGTAGPYVWSTYEQIGQRADNFASGLINLGLCPPRPEDKELRGRGILGFYSKNRLEWVLAEQACFSQAIVTCPMYDTLGPDSVAYVIKQTEMTTLICSADVVKNVLACKSECPTLKCVIQMEPVSAEGKKQAEAAGVQILSMLEVEEAGAKQPLKHRPPIPEDIFTFCYTSGTTGDPKGVLLKHGSIVATYAATRSRPSFNMTADDMHLSYLPLPHIFERAIQFGVIRSGAAIGFYQGETLKILEDIQALRPTIFPSVPRLLNRIHDRLRAGIEEAGGIKKVLFDRAYMTKLIGMREQGSVKHALWDRIIFSKIKERVGLNRIRLIITGSAPIANHVLDFLRIVFGCTVIEGYGLSETSAAGTMTWESDVIPGTVGGVTSCNELRLKDVPDMGYLRTDQVHGKDQAVIPCQGRGEICMRGRSVFQGYYKMPDKTAEVIDEDGWFHTGDIGLWTPDGRLKIIDRKKNIFKLAQGEYVAPEKIENLNVQSKFVVQNFVYGDSLKTELVGIMVVDPDAATAWGKENGVQKDVKQLCEDPKFKKAVLDDLFAIGKQAKLHGYEIVKAIHLESDQWQPGGEVLTPTFKLQRQKAQQKYQATINQLYDEVAKGPHRSKL